MTVSLIFLHNFKVAFRNLRKCKLQTLISVAGMAVGFTCFALAMLWIRYEMTFDSFHEKSKRLYVVYSYDANSQTGYSRRSVSVLASYLKESFPEIAHAAVLSPNFQGSTIIVEDVEIQAIVIEVEPDFFEMLDTRIVEGSISNYDQLAITQMKAKQLFANENPVGRQVTLFGSVYTISAVVSDIIHKTVVAQII